MQKVQLSEDLSLSRLVHGHWRLSEWNLSNQELLTLIHQVMELGITTFDHADIYGNHSCEKLFGKALKIENGLREKMEIISKCGIKIATDKFPERSINYYEYSYDSIIQSVNQSLQNFNTDYLDLLLLHRPSPFFDPQEVSKAFDDLKTSGKVKNFGVSNFTIQQYKTLEAHTVEKLITNQVEISPYCLEHFENGNMDFFMEKQLHPMAWSPLAGGELMNPQTEKGIAMKTVLEEVAEELNIEGIDKIIYAWLAKHPSQIIPIIGSGKIERIKSVTEALTIEMNLEQWFKIYTPATGQPLP